MIDHLSDVDMDAMLSKLRRTVEAGGIPPWMPPAITSLIGEVRSQREVIRTLRRQQRCRQCVEDWRPKQRPPP